jgi:hypothetical protein
VAFGRDLIVKNLFLSLSVDSGKRRPNSISFAAAMPFKSSIAAFLAGFSFVNDASTLEERGNENLSSLRFFLRNKNCLVSLLLLLSSFETTADEDPSTISPRNLLSLSFIFKKAASSSEDDTLALKHSDWSKSSQLPRQDILFIYCNLIHLLRLGKRERESNTLLLLSSEGLLSVVLCHTVPLQVTAVSFIVTQRPFWR